MHVSGIVVKNSHCVARRFGIILTVPGKSPVIEAPKGDRMNTVENKSEQKPAPAAEKNISSKIKKYGSYDRLQG
jgi:hypothetical protein